MSNKSPNQETVREKAKALQAEAERQGDLVGWFERLYAEAAGDANSIPWAMLQPHPKLQEWLQKDAPVATGKKALVIGCGLGDDAEALSQAGFEVTAFDVSSQAIAWCRSRFPHSRVNYEVADLLHLDAKWHQYFDLVFESRTVQSLPLKVRSQAIEAVASLVAPKGILLLIAHLRETEAEPNGPPWPLSLGEVAQFSNRLGLSEVRRETFYTGENNDVVNLRVEYHRR
jgi:2-polyprenyl-3-methyl-5-hydroxy-6-metoxy-1,4-benzoquinol methylase